MRNHIYDINMSGFMKTVLRTQDDDIKIKRKVSLFSSPVYLAFTVVLSLFSSFLHGLSESEKSSEIEVKPNSSGPFS